MEITKAPQFQISSDNILRLKPPVTILVKANVLQAIKQNYLPNGESGGLLWLKPYRDSTSLVIDRISVVKNISSKNSAYTPEPNQLASAYGSVFDSGYLPVFYHTHPTTLGHSLYDHRRPQFYLKSSVPDRREAAKPINYQNIQILLPEVIGVASDKYTGGIDVVFYEGGILPVSWNRLSTTQIVVSIVGILGVFVSYQKGYKKSTAIFVLFVIIFLINEERKRPIYTELPSGDTLVSINKAFL